MTFHGDASLDDFHTVDGVMAEDLVKWDSIGFNGIDANLNPQSVSIREIDVDNAYARLVIETNKTINLLNALRLTGTNAPATNETQAGLQPVRGVRRRDKRGAAADFHRRDCHHQHRGQFHRPFALSRT